MQKKFGEQVIQYFTNISTDWSLPEGISLLKPFESSTTVEVFSHFYRRFFNDQYDRVFILGINPGRLGAGVTGIPFTDPIILEKECDIPNTLHKRHELSAIYVYELINAFGGPDAFYRHFYINSVCPLGFVKDGVNINYYDDKELYKAVKPFIVSGIQDQIAFGCRTDIAISLGKGLNQKFLQQLNQEYKFFEKVIALPHPRWVMQYRRKTKDTFIDEAVSALSEWIS